ncbi:galanin receptor type 1-like [Saccostrea echinata]|uniref:galanin receptor type 1-like n=1 Tax=Saccostrea echinata TaxID=191078 RepID=UPI002A800A23|nr:galanin receptor type 1-like [Saccostrea echinata]XP_061177299.1 galanin receptor type 1-like [Saccostrea echinata]XP_061177300.1 galanin receptor type 1-like [Saccostrea echinata]
MIDGRNLTIMGKTHDMNATQDILFGAGPDAPPPPPPFQEGFELFMAINEFIKIAIPVIFSLGFPLNWITFHIFARSKLKDTSSSRYIAAIAFVDNGVIFTHFLTHLSAYFNIPVFKQHGACQMVNYFNFMCTFLSIWYVTALVIDKFIGLYWPVKRSEYCTEFRAKCVAVSLAIFSVVFYHHLVWTMGPEEVFGKTICLPYAAPGLYETWSTLNKVDYVLVAIIPYFTIVILLCLILFKVFTYKSHTRQFNGSVRGRPPSVSTEQEFKTMPLAIVVAIATIVLGFLNNICRIFQIVQPIVATVATFLSQLSFACKFFLYVMTSDRFRDELVGLGRQIIYHVSRPCRCNRHDAGPTFITVNQQTDDVHEFHCIIEGSV